MKNFTKSLLFAMSFLALSNNVSAVDTAILDTIKEISVDRVSDLEKVELMDRIEALNSILVNTIETGNDEESELVIAKIELLDQVMTEKYPTLWKKVKTFVVKHQLAVSATAVVLVAAIVITIVLVKKNKSEQPAVEDKQPAVEDKQPAVEDKQPAVEIEATNELFNQLSPRVRNVLTRNDITNDKAVKDASDETLMEIAGFGPASLDDVHEVFGEYVETTK